MGILSFLFLAIVIGPGVCHIMAVAAPGDDALSGGGALVMKGCLGRGVQD